MPPREFHLVPDILVRRLETLMISECLPPWTIFRHRLATGLDYKSLSIICQHILSFYRERWDEVCLTDVVSKDVSDAMTIFFDSLSKRRYKGLYSWGFKAPLKTSDLGLIGFDRFFCFGDWIYLTKFSEVLADKSFIYPEVFESSIPVLRYKFASVIFEDLFLKIVAAKTQRPVLFKPLPFLPSFVVPFRNFT